MKEKFFKLPYAELAFEITRRCNLSCGHCMRGEAQNHTISKEVIDRALDEILIAKRIHLTGGEPFLEPEMISYLVDGIISREIPILSLSCVTNGTIRDEHIVESWNKITDYVANKFGKILDKKELRTIGRIAISDDQYHNQEELMDTVRFYRERLNEHTIVTKENLKPDDTILLLGRAAENSNIKHSKNVRYKVCPYRLEVSKDFIETTIQIGWDGKILIGEDSSYKQQDKYNYGNILEHHISELMECGFLEEMISEEEARVYDYIYTRIMTENYDSENRDDNYIAFDEEFCRAFIELFETAITARKNIHKAYPDVSYEEIVNLAYDDMNINIRKTNEKPFLPLLAINKGRFERTIEESRKRIEDFLQDHFLETIIAKNTLDKDVKPISLRI